MSESVTRSGHTRLGAFVINTDGLDGVNVRHLRTNDSIVIETEGDLVYSITILNPVNGEAMISGGNFKDHKFIRIAGAGDKGLLKRPNEILIGSCFGFYPQPGTQGILTNKVSRLHVNKVEIAPKDDKILH